MHCDELRPSGLRSAVETGAPDMKSGKLTILILMTLLWWTLTPSTTTASLEAGAPTPEPARTIVSVVR